MFLVKRVVQRRIKQEIEILEPGHMALEAVSFPGNKAVKCIQRFSVKPRVVASGVPPDQVILLLEGVMLKRRYSDEFLEIQVQVGKGIEQFFPAECRLCS